MPFQPLLPSRPAQDLDGGGQELVAVFTLVRSFLAPLSTQKDVWLEVSDHTVVIIWVVKIFSVQVFYVFLYISCL